jgi:hypothetical protein
MVEGMKCPGCGTAGEPGDAFCQHCGGRLGHTTGAQPDGRWLAAQTLTNSANEATRFLCAGAYLDDSFANRVLKELFGQTYRAIAPSYGFDLAVVSEHCLTARHRRRIRDMILVALAATMFLIGAVPLVWIGGVAWLFGLMVASLRDGPEGLRLAIYRFRWRSLVARLVIAFLVFWLVFGVAFTWSVVVTTIQLGASLPGGAPDLTLLGNLFGSPGNWLLVALGWIVLYGVIIGDLYVRRQAVGGITRTAFRIRPRRNVPVSARLRKRLDAIASEQTGNVTVYSGYDPFVGTGSVLRGWSFAMPLVPKQGHDQAVERFSVADLVDRVRQAVAGVASGNDAVREEALRGLVVSDHVFVSGLGIQGDDRFLPQRAGPPRVRLAEEEVRRIAGAPHGAVRHYCSVHVQSWGGEVVAFIFFHFSIEGQKLYFECVKRVLPPVRREYHRVDTMRPLMTGGELIRMVDEAASSTVPAVIGAPGRLIRDLAFDSQANTPPDDIVIDYGAPISVRELAAEDEFHNYFQQLDADKHLKIVERHVLGAIAEFLDEHGIDTSEFRSQQSNITNYNTVNQTGANNVVGAANFAAGGTATHSGDVEQRAGAAARGGA